MFCSSCGNSLTGDENFCSSCGVKSKHSSTTNTRSEKLKTFEFSSNILLGGNILAPDRLIITSSEVVFRKRNSYLIGVDESSIPFERISSVEIDRKLIDVHIIIYSNGNQKIRAEDFSIRDAKKIKKLIEDRIYGSQN